MGRYNEFESRGKQVELLGSKIQQVRKFIVKYQKEDESVSHIDSGDVEKVSKAVTDIGNWYDNSMNQINGLKKDQDPPENAAPAEKTDEQPADTKNGDEQPAHMDVD